MFGEEEKMHIEMQNVEKRSRGIVMLKQSEVPSPLGDRIFHKGWDFHPKDDLTGKDLGPALITGAKREELTEMYRRQVWVEKYIEDCFRDIGEPPIPAPWLKTNKGDELHPNVRCRLVAKHLAAKYGVKT